MDDKHPHHFVSEDRAQVTKVKWLNSENFEEEILKNKNVE